MIAALSVHDYEAAFVTEQMASYPMVDAWESAAGYAIDRTRLEAAARVLACPLKTSPPNWQHGRVLYAAVRAHCAEPTGFVNVLDIGTAKGFSALCLQWALDDHAGACTFGVTSVDVIDPAARVARNTVAEVDGLLTLAETLAPWPEASRIQFEQSTGIDWLLAHHGRINVAFVDGTHDPHVVQQEGYLLAERQAPGDLAIFDDVDRPNLLRAVQNVRAAYAFDILEVLPTRHYAIGVRR